MSGTLKYEKMMTVADVANYLGFKPSTIYSYVNGGKIPVYKVSGRWRFDRNEIEEWLKENTVAAGNDKKYRSEMKELYNADEAGKKHKKISVKGCGLLQNCGILNGLTPEEIDLFTGLIRCRERRYKDGETVIFDTQKMRSFFIVEKGVISIPMGTGEGTVNDRQAYRRGNIMGLDVMMTKEHTSYFTAVAKGDVLVMVYDFKTFLSQGILPDAVKIILFENISRILADENIRRMKKIEMLLKKNLRGRVLSYLVQAEKREGGSPFELTDTRSELAQHLGINRSVLSNELNMLRRDRIINFKKNTFEILCSGAVLDNIVSGEPAITKESIENARRARMTVNERVQDKKNMHGKR